MGRASRGAHGLRDPRDENERAPEAPSVLPTTIDPIDLKDSDTMELANLIRTKRDPNARTDEPLHILFASSEVAPFSKTGGLGDIAASLPIALSERGHHVHVITPLYKHIDPAALHLSRRLRTLEVPRKGANQSKVNVTLWEGQLRNGVRILFVDAPEFFDRDGVYGYDGDSFSDNAARFAFFSRAVVEFARASSASFDVVHCNDWHTGLVPAYARHYHKADFVDTKFVFTIHNLAYQGQFDKSEFNATGMPRKAFLNASNMLHDGQLNFLKLGLVHSDHLTTVSPTYAEEIQTPEGGCGLDALLIERQEDLTGILNGADYTIWSPEIDHDLPVRYDAETLNGKRRNKAHLQHHFKLPVRPTLPLLGFIGRLTSQKGLDLLIPALRDLIGQFESERYGFQVVFLGEGDASYQEELAALQRDFPRRVGVHIGYEEQLAHQIQAGSDILLVPSLFEPCGLSQIYALRYGTLPLVHATGGLADTVVEDGADVEINTGFVFDEYTQDALATTIERATERYTHYRQWRPLMINAMEQNFSWNQSARQYEDVYRQG